MAISRLLRAPAFLVTPSWALFEFTFCLRLTTFIDDFNFPHLNGNFAIAIKLFDLVILLRQTKFLTTCVPRTGWGGSPTVKEGLFVFDETLSALLHSRATAPGAKEFCKANR
jgi:hypothetical protein